MDTATDINRTSLSRPPTVAELAAAKGLPVEALTRHGVADTMAVPHAERLARGITKLGVWIPYHNLDGTIAARTRLRFALKAKDGSRWLETDAAGSPVPYGLADLADARAEGYVCLTEGETDYWTLRHAGFPALGMPGASSANLLQRAHLEGVRSLYVCRDNDPAGAAFVTAIRQRVATAGIPVHAVAIPDGCKDVNDLYRRDPAAFRDVFAGLLLAADSEAPTFAAGDSYALSVPTQRATLTLDRPRRTPWGDLTGELWATSGDTVLSIGNVNVSDVRKRQEHVKELTKRAPDTDWSGLVEDFAIRCLKAEREGTPAIILRDVTPLSATPCWQVGQFELGRQWPTCLFGDGGTGKSYIALHLLGELAIAGVRVLYLDGEFDADVHRTRLEKLYGADMPALHYLRLVKPLELSVEHVRREITRLKIDYVAIDSVGVLTQGAPEEAEAALGYVRALRQLGVGSLSVAHVTKNSEIKSDKQKPFGSVFYHNGFRRTYFAEQVCEPDGERVEIAVWNPKVNEGKQQPPFGLAVTFGEAVTTIEPCDLTDTNAGERLPSYQRIAAALKRGAMSTSELAEALGLKTDSVSKTLRRHTKLFTSPSLGMWALRADDY